MAGSGNTPARPAPGMPVKTRRTMAKAGMALSMGVLVGSALMGLGNSESRRKAHLLSGAALVGFSLWHVTLYPSTNGRRRS